MESQTKVFILYVGDPDDEAGQRGVATLSAARIERDGDRVRLFDENGGQVARLLVPSPTKIREI